MSLFLALFCALTNKAFANILVLIQVKMAKSLNNMQKNHINLYHFFLRGKK